MFDKKLFKIILVHCFNQGFPKQRAELISNNLLPMEACVLPSSYAHSQVTYRAPTIYLLLVMDENGYDPLPYTG
jgi:hypothetical protein